ncbi:MAG: beta-galactosidase, partial [Burkholderiales bacterium]|nr:beta-galactosidase [Opitutaceae bacterium]
MLPRPSPSSVAPAVPAAPAAPHSPLGAQIWLEPDDSAARVDQLCAHAAASGLGWLRIFLMWPWIERTPEQWDFTVFDHVFAAAEKHGLKIKATLTANSGPAWIGTPATLHSVSGFLSPDQRAPMQRYIEKCVQRYVGSPALAQWILWNEPAGGGDRTPETLARWREFLRERYRGDLIALNHRWLTAFTDFNEIPFWNELPHTIHRGYHWNPYRAALDDADFRPGWLGHELRWIADLVRALDPRSDLCINPTQVLANQAAGGTDLEDMGRICEVIGASYHPAWQFSPFAQRADYPALMSAGVRHCAVHPPVRRVEGTEVQ